MAISHVCLSCGADLAPVRVTTDPVYGLAVRTCPSCAAVTATPAHPIWRWWHKGLETAGVVAVLAFKVIAALGLWALSIYTVRALVTFDPVLRDGTDLAIVALTAFAAGVLNGVWITAGLAHLRRRPAWLGWLGFLLGATALTMAPDVVLAPHAAGRNLVLFESAVTLTFLASLVVIMPLGVPLGRALLGAGLRRRLRRRRRARTRRRERGVR